VLCQPAYLAGLVEYYAPSVQPRPLDDGVAAAGRTGGHTFILASPRLASSPVDAGKRDRAVNALGTNRELVGRWVRPNVIVWEFK
jgi:hypothetical protein